MPTRAAIGFRAHSGWAAAVAVSGSRKAPAVVMRRRIAMVDRGVPGPVQPYHASVGLEPAAAQRVVSDCARIAAAFATSGLRNMLDDLRALGHSVTCGGLLLASGRPLPALESILASHALIHTAEGELFRESLRAAAAACAIRLTEVRERELFGQASLKLGVPESEIQAHMAAMGKSIGPPWTQDEKFAAVAAWLSD